MFLFGYRKKSFSGISIPKKTLILVPALLALPAVAGIGAVGAGIKNSGIFANPSHISAKFSPFF
jgi:hypothetical protein